jgi:hypothetical protein
LVQLRFCTRAQTLARPSSNVEHPVVPLTPNRHFPMLAITLASGIAIALIALRTPDLQHPPQDSLTPSRNLAHPAMEPPSQSDTAVAQEDAGSSVALERTATAPAQSPLGSTTTQESAAPCREGYEPHEASKGKSNCAVLTAPSQSRSGSR